MKNKQDAYEKHVKMSRNEESLIDVLSYDLIAVKIKEKFSIQSVVFNIPNAQLLPLCFPLCLY